MSFVLAEIRMWTLLAALIIDILVFHTLSRYHSISYRYVHFECSIK